MNIFNLTEINDWQVLALVTPSRHPFKNVLDSRANNGTPKRSRYSDLSTRRQFKRKQRSRSLSTSLNSLHQLSSAIKSLQVPSPVHEEIKCSKKDVLSPTKLNQVSVEDFVEKVVGRILKEVEKVWIQLQFLENTAEVSLKTRYNDVIFVKENNWVFIAILTLMSSIDKNVPTRRAFVLETKDSFVWLVTNLNNKNSVVSCTCKFHPK